MWADPVGAAVLLGAFLPPVLLLAIFFDPDAFFPFLVAALFAGFVLPPIFKKILIIYVQLDNRSILVFTEIPVALSTLMIRKINRS